MLLASFFCECLPFLSGESWSLSGLRLIWTKLPRRKTGIRLANAFNADSKPVSRDTQNETPALWRRRRASRLVLQDALAEVYAIDGAKATPIGADRPVVLPEIEEP